MVEVIYIFNKVQAYLDLKAKQANIKYMFERIISVPL
jgi:hypothetical protein